MSYHCFNLETLLKNVWNKYQNKGEKQKAAKYYAANQEVLREDSSIETCQRRKRLKRGNIKGKDTTRTLT